MRGRKGAGERVALVGDPLQIAPWRLGSAGLGGLEQGRLARAGPDEAGLGWAAGPRPIPNALMDWLVRRALCAEPIRKHLPRYTEITVFSGANLCNSHGGAWRGFDEA